MLEAVPYWTIIAPVTITNILLPGENITIPVTFILPDMEIPLQLLLLEIRSKHSDPIQLRGGE